MPKIKESEGIIPKIYRRKYEDIAMYFYVKGQMNIMPAISVEKALYNYFKAIGEDNFNIESAHTTYCRIQSEFYELQKT